MKRLSPYNLTPLGSDWSWGLRSLEIVFQTVSIALWPFVWLYKAMDAVADKLFK